MPVTASNINGGKLYMKKLLALVLASVMVLSLAACGSGSPAEAAAEAAVEEAYEEGAAASYYCRSRC